MEVSVASLKMRGPYDLTPEKIDRFVTPHVPGVFAVGYTRESGAFVVSYIGRSDSDIRSALREQSSDETARFKWMESASAMAAFDTQCELYHEFGGPDSLENEEHPGRPKGSKWVCPVCDIFDR
jgi:hypothetical protein